jgi:transmembrane sensor
MKTDQEQKNMEYWYIHKKMNGTITPEEDDFLAAWLKKSPSNLAFFLKIKNFEMHHTPDNTRQAWEKIGRRLKLKRQIRISLSVAAVVLALIMLSFLLPFGSDGFVEQSDLALLNPGVEKAVLMLSDGSSYELESKKELSIEEKGASINCNDGAIVYSVHEQKTPKMVYNTIQVPRGGEFFLQLSDSTKVWINSQTVLRYPTVFQGSERIVQLYGEAYFEVKEDKTRPFRVITDSHVVEVTGTCFNISSFSEENSVVTTLVEGSVSVYSNKLPSKKAVLLPGDQSVFPNDSEILMVRQVDVGLYTTWKDGYYQFYNQSLENMMNTLSRWYNFEFSFQDDASRNLRFSGRLKRTDQFEVLLSILEKTNEIYFEVHENQVIIK